MVRHKWILKVRNQIANFIGECNSPAAIEGARMSNSEREELKGKLSDICRWIDNKLGF